MRNKKFNEKLPNMTMNKTRKVSALWKTATAAACVLIVTACGGGGGGSDPAASPSASPLGVLPPASGNTTTISGAVTKGPVSGAVLELFDIDTFGQPLGAAVATGTTTLDGNFSISVPTDSGTLLVVSSGGSFIDESDQEPDVAQKRRIQLAANESFFSLLPQGQTAVAVTPITTALVLRGRILGGPDGSFLSKFNASKAVLDTQAGFDVLATIPANPVAPESNATEAQKQYALLLGGLANLANNVAIQLGASAPTYDMIVAITFDLVDGQFDGLSFGQANVPGPILLPTDLDFAAEVNRFRNNNFDNFSTTIVPSIEVTTFANNAPTASAGADAATPQNTAVQLDGTASTDPDSGVFYSWVQTSGTTVTLDNDAVAAPSFNAPQRLVGNETLIFELTVIDTIGLTSVDSVEVQVIGAVPATFWVVDDAEAGDGIGVDFDGGGRITLNTDGTGNLLDDVGTKTFTYVVAANVLTLNFSPARLVDDEDEFFDVDGDGVFDDQFLVEDFADFFELTLTADTPNGDVFSFRESGTRTFTPIMADDTKAPEPYNLTDMVTALDPGQATPFSFADGDQRTLLFNSFATFNTLLEDDDLYQDLFTFNANGSGTTLNNGVNFTYTVATDGSLGVTFVNGESAKYINLETRPSGDIMASEFTLTAPLVTGDDAFIGDVSLSIPVNTAAPVPSTLADAAGIYSGTFFDDEIPNANLDLRLNPDGTGSLNFDSVASRFFLYDFDDVIVFRSNFGVCWNLDGNNDIVVNRAQSLNEIPNTFSSETTPAFCSALTEAGTGFQFNLIQLDNDGTTFKHFDRRLDSCSQDVTPPCSGTPTLSLSDFNLRITTRTPLTATPPVAALDTGQTPDAMLVVVDLLANDVARDLAIDPTSVTIVRGPFFGTASVDATNGQLSYTPNPGITQDVLNYIVRDTAGNPSQVQTIEIVISPCAEINGSRGFFDRFSGDCDYAGIVGAGNAATANVTFGPLPMGGVHKFNDSLFIGQDFNTDADLAGAGITQGGDGPSLNIGAGTVLAFSNPGALISVRRGSQINVGGTETNPVVMTSQDDIDSKRDIANGGTGFQPFNATQQWAGLTIHGFGVTNACTYSGAVSTSDLAVSGECHVPSDSAVGFYGGINNADSSGAINYLQIKHSGANVNGDDTGGLALFAAGSGTALANIEVYSTNGDGMQLIGGAANIQNFVGLYARAATIGIDEGYQGAVSNALLIQGEFSGNQCVVAGGIVDATSLTPAEIDALITQGINSRPLLSNITCVVSATAFDSGRGLNFFDGAFGALVDTIVTVPGIDDGATLNYCIGVEDRSLQGVQDLDLSIASSIFACPDKTDGEVLPNSTPLDAFLTAAGSQFTNTLIAGSVNPPPVAGTGNVLLEGSPLIYAVPQASLQIDGSPTTVTPMGTFIGAVQQGTTDWTLNWTFGLHPGLRQVPLWYEGPIVVTPGIIRESKGQVATLDASETVAAASPVTYQWTQVGGDLVTLSDATAVAPTFTTPGVGTNLTTPGGVFDFEVTVTDANGLQASRMVTVDVGASVPQEFYSVAESIIPSQFNRPFDGGERVQLSADNTGTYRDFAGPLGLSWSDTPTTFTMNINGGLFGPVFTTSEDPDGDTIFETINNSERVDTIVSTLVADNGPKKLFTVTISGEVIKSKASDNTALPSVPFSNVAESNSTQAIVAVTDGIAFPPTSAVRNLITNVATGVPTLLNPTLLRMDLMTFNGDGTGFAKNKNIAFNYSNTGATLVVNFLDGEVAEYTRIFNNSRGDAVGVLYTKTDSTMVSFVSPSADTTNPAPASQGIYRTNLRVELDNGTFVDSKLFFRLHPEGTGQVEVESVNTTTGLLEAVTVSTAGICWQLDANSDLEISRTQSADQRFAGSRVPTTAHCSVVQSPDNTLIDFKRTGIMLKFNPSFELLSYVEERRNQCLTGTMGCDNTILELTNTEVRNFDPIVFFSGNPPLAAVDSTSVSGGFATTVDILFNDIAGDSPIDPTNVTIVAGPANGIASIDVTTGEITYTGNSGFSGTDEIYYRVKDLVGNDSTIGTVIITVL
ncbi:MAG: hypothetical protein ACJA0W_000849 [Candidatus Azotimanducaceae bacterium]|jgi:hypothetical protein